MLLCAAAEAVGISAAALASRISWATVGEPSTVTQGVAVLALVTAGGLVEGAALALAQRAGLRAWRPRLRTAGYVTGTVAVAGLGWAGASAPSALSGTGDGRASAPWLIVLGAAALGGVMGLVLGGVQAATLRRQVSHPWRWVVANAIAWIPAMTVIFVGATLPGRDWPTAAVVATGAVTGAVAGALLGAVLGWSLPSLQAAAPHDRAVLALLGGTPGAPTPARRARGAVRRILGRALIGLCVRGVASGRWVELPVMYAADGAGLVLRPGRPDRKRWWRNVRGTTTVAVLRDGRWQRAQAVVLRDSDPGYADALVTYGRRWPRATIPAGAPLVRVRV